MRRYRTFETSLSVNAFPGLWYRRSNSSSLSIRVADNLDAAFFFQYSSYG
jgi:hypothetical protein